MTIYKFGLYVQSEKFISSDFGLPQLYPALNTSQKSYGKYIEVKKSTVILKNTMNISAEQTRTARQGASTPRVMDLWAPCAEAVMADIVGSCQVTENKVTRIQLGWNQTYGLRPEAVMANL